MSSDDLARKHIFECYKVMVDSRMSERTLQIPKFRDKVTTYLDEVSPENRLNAQLYGVLQCCAKNNPSWRLDMASEVMRRMEKYALNLLDYPWKSEFHTVKTYSGFYKTKLEQWVSPIEKLFPLLGYELNCQDSFVLNSQPKRTKLKEVALDFFLASIELNNCDLMHRTSHLKDITAASVFLYRCQHQGRLSNEYLESLPKELFFLETPNFISFKQVLDVRSPRNSSFAARGVTGMCLELSEVSAANFQEHFATLDEHLQDLGMLKTDCSSHRSLMDPNEWRQHKEENILSDVEQIRLQRSQNIGNDLEEIVLNEKKINPCLNKQRVFERFIEDSRGSQQYDTIDGCQARDQRNQAFSRVNRNGVTTKENEHFKETSPIEFDSRTITQTHPAESWKTIEKGRSRKALQKIVESNIEPIDSSETYCVSVKSKSEDKGTKLNIANSTRQDDQLWQCSACTYANDPVKLVCEMCAKSRARGAEDKPLEIGGHDCPKCHFVNSPGDRCCKTCNSNLTGSSTYV